MLYRGAANSLVTSIIFMVAASTPSTSSGAKPDQPLRVYILAGQSNMQGQGVVDLDHPEHYNGGQGILARVMLEPRNRAKFKHIKDRQGNWVVRDDVWCRYQTDKQLKKGPLTIGFTGYPGKHHIGPEFQFGHVVGDATNAPVLLIKTAWGGKSLYKDFRPPSSGGETGPYYTRMIAEVREALAALRTDFPAIRSRRYQLSGFVWFQGWNDIFGPPDERDQYSKHLVNLINDVRKEFDRPALPVVIGELGNLGDAAGKNLVAIRQQQQTAAQHPSFEGTVVFVKTSQFARPKEKSPNVGHGHHWFGNAESYFLIGDALGRAMLKLHAGN
jgi:hypothetical protein